MGAMTPVDGAIDEKAVAAEAEKALADIALIKAETAKVIFGQEKVVDGIGQAAIGTPRRSRRAREQLGGARAGAIVPVVSIDRHDADVRWCR